MRRAALLLVLAAACHSWHTQPLAPESVLATHPSRIRITRTDGSRISIDQPTIHADTIVGTLHGSSYHQPVAIRLADVQNVATLRPNSLKTMLLFGTVVALFYFTVTFAGAKFD